MAFRFLQKFSRQQSGNELVKGMTDAHSHLLPGVDDGVGAIGESLEILKEYERLGVEEVWLTPHIMEEMHNSPERLRAVFSTLCDAYKGNVRLHLASENMMDSLLDENIRNKDLLPIGKNGDKLLIETSYFDRPANFHNTIEEIMSIGFTPVLAHPERYNYMGAKDYAALKDLGVLFQLNLFSANGFYGSAVKAKAENLIEKRMYDFTGTDLHSIRYISYLTRLHIARKHRQYLFEISHNQF